MKRNFFVSLVPTLTAILFSAISFLFVFNTNNYKLDSFALSLYNNKVYSHNNYESVILKLKKNKPISDADNVNNYQTIFSQYYYHSQVRDTRLLFDNIVTDGKNNLQLYTQNTFSINNDFLPDGGHYVDYGIFSAYYADDILGSRKYLERRFNCDSFIFISDTYADYLLNEYNITTYEELITKEEYCVLNVKVDDGNTAKFCINNILYSNKRHGGRARELYNFFGLVYNSTTINSWSSFHLELDLKSYPFGTRRVLEGVNKLGYNKTNSSFSFYNYDQSAYKYTENKKANTEFLSLFSNSNLWDSLFVVSVFLDVVCLVFELLALRKTVRIYKYSLMISFLVFIVYGIILAFVQINYLVSITPVLSILTILIMQRKEVVHAFRTVFCKIFRSKIEEFDSHLYTIEI